MFKYLIRLIISSSLFVLMTSAHSNPLPSGLPAFGSVSPEMLEALKQAQSNTPQATAAPVVVVAPAEINRIFGSQIFGGTFHGNLNQGFNSDYVISVGDKVFVRLWGGINFESGIVVDPQGNIFIPNVGPINVAGVTSGNLNSIVEKGIRKTYKENVNVYAALDSAQQVKVFVTGFVRQPGLYAGVAADSPIAFLDKAGGVDVNKGSYLDITVKRAGKERKKINLYSFLMRGDLDLVQFQDGDVIVVGPRQHTFSVFGEVYNSNDFEFDSAKIPLSKALDIARLKPGATHFSVVRRQGSEKTTEYYSIDKINEVSLFDGDSVTVSADRFAGTIQVRVEGAHSGQHAIVLPYGAKLPDVLKQIKPNSMSRLDAIQLYRLSVKQRQQEMLLVALQKIEEAALSARSKTNEEALLRSKEADLLLKFVEKAKLIKPKGQVILAQSEAAETLLEDGDILVIPEKSSLVMTHGEVVFPNAVSWTKDSVVGDYIQQSGNYSQAADSSKVILIKQNGATSLATSSTPVQAGDEIMVLPKIETKSYEMTRVLTQVLYQIAFTARVAFGL